MSVRRGVAALLTMMLSAAMISVLPDAPPASAAPAAETLSDLPLTLSGTGAFANLKLTVGQTKNLVNQAVTVSWTGGAPTLPAGGFGVDYLQIILCSAGVTTRAATRSNALVMARALLNG